MQIWLAEIDNLEINWRTQVWVTSKVVNTYFLAYIHLGLKHFVLGMHISYLESTICRFFSNISNDCLTKCQ